MKTQIANEIREYLQEGTSHIVKSTFDYELDLTFDIAKVITYIEEETNYHEFDIVGEFKGGSIDIKGASLCDSDLKEILTIACDGYNVSI